MQSGKYFTYKKGDSFFHQLNPITKIFFSFFLTILIMISPTSFQLFLLGFLILCYLFSKLSFSYLISSVYQIRFFLLGILILNLFSNLSNPILSILKIINLTFLSSFFLFTTKKKEFLYGMEILFSPLKKIKVPVEEIVLMISLALWFIPNFLEYFDKMRKSLKMKVDYDTLKGKEKGKMFLTFLSAYFVLTLKNVEEISDVMELKGYEVGKKRTSYEKYPFTLKDWILIFLFVLLLFVRRIFLCVF